MKLKCIHPHLKKQLNSNNQAQTMKQRHSMNTKDEPLVSLAGFVVLRAHSTTMRVPFSVEPSRSWIASSASRFSLYSTNANPKTN